MRFGVCAPLQALDALIAAGFDYFEPPVTGLLQPEQPEAEILPPLLAALRQTKLTPETFNLLLPGDLKVVGPGTDNVRQVLYLDAAFGRAAKLGGKLVVFGSGGARRIPDGWPLEKAHQQVSAFLTTAGTIAGHFGATVAIEPLNVAECNFINSVGEAVALAKEVSSPNVGVLSDLYHITHDSQSYDETRDAAPWLRHVHVAGSGRRAPTAADFEYLREYFAVLKAAGYAGRISIEANWDNLEEQAAEARQVVGRAWDAA